MDPASEYNLIRVAVLDKAPHKGLVVDLKGSPGEWHLVVYSDNLVSFSDLHQQDLALHLFAAVDTLNQFGINIVLEREHELPVL